MSLAERMYNSGFLTWTGEFPKWASIPVGKRDGIEMFADEKAIVAYLKWLGLAYYTTGSWD